MSSRFSEDRDHQLQTSMRHARRSPPTRRGGHLPPPTLMPSIPITLAFVSRMPALVQRNICHAVADLPVYMQTNYVSRTFFVKREPRVTPLCEIRFLLNATRRRIPRRRRRRCAAFPALSGTLPRDSHLKTTYFRHFTTGRGRAPIYATGAGSDMTAFPDPFCGRAYRVSQKQRIKNAQLKVFEIIRNFGSEILFPLRTLDSLTYFCHCSSISAIFL